MSWLCEFYIFLGRSRARNRKVPPNKRDCLSKALQAYTEVIVNTTIFEESHLPDSLITEECLTEDECSYIRKRKDTKDQIRILLVLIRGRDMKILEKFLSLIEQDNVPLADKIRDRFQRNVKEGLKDKRCVRCKLKVLVNIKYVADRLYANMCITDKLYNCIIHSEHPAGDQDDLWDRLLKELEATEDPNTAMSHMVYSLMAKGHYKHLADVIEDMIEKYDRLLECACGVLLRSTLQRSMPYVRESVDPRSSESSASEISVELRSKTIERRVSRPKAVCFSSQLIDNFIALDEGKLQITLCTRR